MSNLEITKEGGVSQKREKSRGILLLEGLGCASCAGKIEREAGRIGGVSSASVDFAAKRLLLETDGSRNMDSVLQEAEEKIRAIEPHVKVLRTGAAETAEDSAAFQGKAVRNGVSVALFALAMLLNPPPWAALTLFFVSYVLSGGEVVLQALKNMMRGDFFDENFLMTVATVGAFAIGEYAEGAAVMIFFQTGELLQALAVNRSRRSIASLVGVRPDFANLKSGGKTETVAPSAVKIGELIAVRPGEKIPLDGTVTEGESLTDTSALTGESVPRNVRPGDEVMAGFINLSGLLTVRVTKVFGESAVAKILDLVQNATANKAPTEKFITRFSKKYTPAVLALALLIALIPPLALPGAQFSDWFYRALVFLVISCPCALVVSIPLGFFGGIGKASRNGILIKGSNFLEALNSVGVVVFDKTGTLTRGVFSVTAIEPEPGFGGEELLKYAAYAELHSGHPIARSVLAAYGSRVSQETVDNYREISGFGVAADISGRRVLAGNGRLMERENIVFTPSSQSGTVVYVAVDGIFAGSLVISDQLRPDAAETVSRLRALGVRSLAMLTGDNEAAAAAAAQSLGLDRYFAELLPHDKVLRVEELEKEKKTGEKLVFMGDGINDAPVLARADIGVAMGGLGSDAAIEAADVVIMTDEPSRLADAIEIAGKTRRLLWRNIVMVFAVKIAVLVLGALGVATMWEAVFADVGVSLLAVAHVLVFMRSGNPAPASAAPVVSE